MMRFWNENWLCGPGSYFHGPFGMFINLAFWIGLILLLIWAFKAVTNQNHSSRGVTTAQDILKRRYAAGEIDREQFEEMRKTIL